MQKKSLLFLFLFVMFGLMIFTAFSGGMFIVKLLPKAGFALTDSLAKREISRNSVLDSTKLLTPGEAQWIGRYHQELRHDHDIDYRVLIVTTHEDLNEFTHAQFKKLDVGGYSQAGRGLLLVIDPEKNAVRLEVSAALEGVYTDAFVAYIEQRQMVHFFKTGQVANGILATTELIFTRAQAAEAGQKFSPPMENFSTGGGAQTQAHLKGQDEGLEPKDLQKDLTVLNHPQSGHTPSNSTTSLSPLQVVEQYHQAMARRDARPDQPFFSRATVAMMKQWTVTPAQMDNVAKEAKQCTVLDVREADQYAVVRYRPEDKTCAPYFLLKEDGAWKLDLKVMQTAIRFNHRNEWHFSTENSYHNFPYRYAFTDWRFDSHGFPLARNVKNIERPSPPNTNDG